MRHGDPLLQETFDFDKYFNRHRSRETADGCRSVRVLTFKWQRANQATLLTGHDRMRSREALEQALQAGDKDYNLSFKVSMCSKVKYPRTPGVTKEILASVPSSDTRPPVVLPREYTEQEFSRIRRFILQEKWQRCVEALIALFSLSAGI